MSRLEIGIGAIIAAIAGLGWSSSVPVNIALLLLGVVLAGHGIYDVYYKPNLGLDSTLKRWLERHYWVVTPADVPADKFYFGIWAQDESKRRVMISRERDIKDVLGFTSPIDLDVDTVRDIGSTLSTIQQQLLYEELHILLASMHMGYVTSDFRKITVQHALPIDEYLSEHAVDLKAKEVVNGVIAAQSAIRKTVLSLKISSAQVREREERA